MAEGDEDMATQTKERSSFDPWHMPDPECSHAEWAARVDNSWRWAPVGSRVMPGLMPIICSPCMNSWLPVSSPDS